MRPRVLISLAGLFTAVTLIHGCGEGTLPPPPPPNKGVVIITGGAV
jgi:hypothetical protein